MVLGSSVSLIIVFTTFVMSGLTLVIKLTIFMAACFTLIIKFAEESLTALVTVLTALVPTFVATTMPVFVTVSISMSVFCSTMFIMVSFQVLTLKWGHFFVKIFNCVVVSTAVFLSIMDLCATVFRMFRSLMTSPVVRCLVLIAVRFSLTMTLGSE